jgi:hypothetical protein
MTKLRKLVATSLVASLALFGAACGDDEDGDGANTDEELNQLDEGAEDGADELEDELDEGADEVDDE